MVVAEHPAQLLGLPQSRVVVQGGNGGLDDAPGAVLTGPFWGLEMARVEGLVSAPMAADPALVAYQAFAAVYNDFNAANDYEMWLGQVLIPELRNRGLREGGKALDVGCGTGRAFRPLLSRGWSVYGLDLSPAMLELAAQEGAAAVPLKVADMRELPRLGGFDLVLSLNDSVNYLLGDHDLVNALAGMRANLAQAGLVIFDVNSRSTYESGYSEVREVEHLGSKWVWTGRGEIAPSIFEA